MRVVHYENFQIVSLKTNLIFRKEKNWKSLSWLHLDDVSSERWRILFVKHVYSHRMLILTTVVFVWRSGLQKEGQSKINTEERTFWWCLLADRCRRLLFEKFEWFLITFRDSSVRQLRRHIWRAISTKKVKQEIPLAYSIFLYRDFGTIRNVLIGTSGRGASKIVPS